ncbi:MAG: methyltransferase domain-containing protein [Pirellulaceae bacterium]|nr:methyltransferase domain-containing protein [Pirellulaceae bacterium]MDP6555795.1 methyltransferase domain-containing protein [Pirellulaceae bacterium]
MNLSSTAGLGSEPLGSLGIPGGWTEGTQVIGDHYFELLLPADPDEFLNQLDKSADAHITDPYWSAIWSAAPVLAECVARHRWPSGTSALELGCGVGLVGLAALAAGVSVTFSDYISLAVSLALENARRNGFPAAEGLQLDWRDPPTLKTFPLVLASDVLYEKRLHGDLLATLDRVLAVDGECWIGDPVRSAASSFAKLARKRGYDVTIDGDTAGRQPSDNRSNFQLLILRRCPA